MKITWVNVIEVDTGINKSIGRRVHTDTGVYGDGEYSPAADVGTGATAAMIT